MAERKTLVLAAGLALGVGLAGQAWWSRGPASEPGVQIARAPADDSAPADAPAPGSKSAKPGQTVQAPLPPPGTPIAQIVDTLKTQADGGDSRAACRLAMELLRCQQLEQAKSMQWEGGPPDMQLEKRGNLEMADRYAEMQIRTIQLTKQCAVLDPALVAQASAYLASAARAGEPEAMLRYALGTHHGVGGLDFLADPDFDRWRRDAPGMLLRAAQAGRMDAVHALGYAYRSDAAPYAGLVPDDPVQAHAWDLVLSRLRGTSQPAFEAPNPAVGAEASALAAQWHQRYFDGAVVGYRLPLQPESLDMPMRPPEEVPFCE